MLRKPATRQPQLDRSVGANKSTTKSKMSLMKARRKLPSLRSRRRPPLRGKLPRRKLPATPPNPARGRVMECMSKVSKQMGVGDPVALQSDTWSPIYDLPPNNEIFSIRSSSIHTTSTNVRKNLFAHVTRVPHNPQSGISLHPKPLGVIDSSLPHVSRTIPLVG